ncbi:hypothetical protein [Methylobacterium soli]|uniref:DNA-directed DNA polymerase family A palm domain-containing protein n=1 Tax=Methylobacterium soli TaxID=553447 RepID=A0A6L3SQU2_9HYPH|nr:hypothetical protein [Methylobacterium soli]KAB1073847.1 hypothetical protein F6X53_26635 [Methylobacterium soli]GJE46834.1 hypothetical protein AEGHOMDF_6043 [Methylobacterium soli]
MQQSEIEFTSSYPSAFGSAQQGPALPEDDDSDWLTSEKDRFFESWRVPVGKAANAVVRRVLNQIQRYEEMNQLRDRKRTQVVQSNFETTVRAIVCDMLHCVITGHTDGVAISRSHRQTTAKSRYKAAFIGKTLPDILDLMASPELSLITQEIGYRDPHATRDQLTKIWPGETLERLATEHDVQIGDIRFRAPAECVILKSTKKGFWDSSQLIDYTDTPETKRKRLEVRQINEWLSGAQIEFDYKRAPVEQPVDIYDRHLRRIFTRRSFTSGGRLFGGFWQRLKREHRTGLLIQGERVCELDYGQIAPRLLYSYAGRKPPEADIYTLPEFANDPKKEMWRKGIKSLMNAVTFMEKPITRKPKGTKDSLPADHSAEELVGMLRRLHPGIAPYFETGIGHHLQFLESQILVEVLMLARTRGIIALPIHDAVIIPSSRTEEVKEIMLSVSEKQTGLIVPVSKKEWGIGLH